MKILAMACLAASAAVAGAEVAVYDVAVVGGGSAGIAAALQAGRAGAKTILLEQGFQVGGTMTSGGVNFPGLFHAWGRQVIDGPGYELVTNAVALSGGELPDFSRSVGDEHWRHQLRFDIPVFVALAEEMLQRAGVRLEYHAAPLKLELADGKWSVEYAQSGDVGRFAARMLIDATGNGAVCRKLGFATVEEGNVRQPGSFVYRLELPADAKLPSRAELERIWRDAVAAGSVLSTDCRIAFADFLAGGGREMNYVPGADNSSGALRGRSAMAGRASMLRMLRFVRTIPGLERTRVAEMAAETGVRETVRIAGEDLLAGSDYRSGVWPPDAVCHAFYPVDIHDAVNGVAPRQLDPGVVGYVPLGCLIPRGSKNLLMAGRFVSADRVAISALRVQAACMAMGQAAGEAAAMAAEAGVTPAELDAELLRQRLRASGAIVPEPPAAKPELKEDSASGGWRLLFNGRDLSGWYTYLKGRGKNCDPKRVFTVKDGVLKITGEEFGALVTEEEFADYHLAVEYRFTGGKQFPGKIGFAPDSGILFHSQGPDGGFHGIWMESLEVNLIKGATGDFWGVGTGERDVPCLSAKVAPNRLWGRFAIADFGGADTYTIRGNDRICRRDIAPDWRDTNTVAVAHNENPVGEWNRVDVYCRGDEVRVEFNGVEVNRGFGAKPQRGRIQLQSEGCAVEFRRVSIRPVPDDCRD